MRRLSAPSPRRSQAWPRKPRTYRQKAHQAILAIVKQRRSSHKVIRRGFMQQLQYLRRNPGHIEALKVTWPHNASRERSAHYPVARSTRYLAGGVSAAIIYRRPVVFFHPVSARGQEVKEEDFFHRWVVKCSPEGRKEISAILSDHSHKCTSPKQAPHAPPSP